MPDDKMLHPHNMVLQLWIDLGASGVAIIIGLLYLGWKFVSQIELSRRPPVLAGITMLALISMVSHSFWQTWSIALMTFFIILVSIQKTQR
jgi:O-antigen ligase